MRGRWEDGSVPNSLTLSSRHIRERGWSFSGVVKNSTEALSVCWHSLQFQRIATGSAWLLTVGGKHIHTRFEEGTQYKKGGIDGDRVAVVVKESTTAYG